MCGCGCNRCKTADAYGMAVPHGGAVTSAPLVTHPASYRGGVEPTGSTRATDVRGESPRFPTGVMVENPGTNQAEVGAPRMSGFGLSLRALVAGGRIVRNDAPVIGPDYGIRGFLGNLLARSAQSVIIPRGASYTGQLPLSEQPKVGKPRPWNDPASAGARYSG